MSDDPSASIPSDLGDREKGPYVSNEDRAPTVEPEDLERFFVERVNAGDVEGLVALYELDAVLAFPISWSGCLITRH